MYISFSYNSVYLQITLVFDNKYVIDKQILFFFFVIFFCFVKSAVKIINIIQ